jgi:hypothetical protein
MNAFEEWFRAEMNAQRLYWADYEAAYSAWFAGRYEIDIGRLIADFLPAGTACNPQTAAHAIRRWAATELARPTA